jgi:hypothetical protein
MWLGILIGAITMLVLAVLVIAIIAALGAAVIARNAEKEVFEIHQHLLDRDLLDLMDDTFPYDEEEEE